MVLSMGCGMGFDMGFGMGLTQEEFRLLPVQCVKAKKREIQKKQVLTRK